MASLASQSAQEIISLTSDGSGDYEMSEKELVDNFQSSKVEETDGSLAAFVSKTPFTANNNHTDIPFCTSGGMSTLYSYGMVEGMSSGGMIMYMDGFRFSLKGGQPCLNLYFENWTLDSRNKFLFSMACIVALGIFTEFVSSFRYWAQGHWTGKQKRIGITLLHGLQALVGYVLMLATMTFSVELFFSVVFGLGLGYALFYKDGDTHVTTNPCCNFLQNEAHERNETAIKESGREGNSSQRQDHDGEDENDASMEEVDTIRVARVKTV